jgi:hypothetical protein
MPLTHKIKPTVSDVAEHAKAIKVSNCAQATFLDKLLNIGK